MVWRLDSLESVGGLPVEVRGAPELITTPEGPALYFDGEDDALLLDANPLAGAEAYTVEAIFRPDSGGEEEQRFLHIQEHASSDRMLLETRVQDDGTWFLDTFVKTRGERYSLYAKNHLHPLDRWYHVALVVDGRTMRHYVDGKLELIGPIDFSPMSPGYASIGARSNRVSWFRGAIREIRLTPLALTPEELRSAR